MMNKAQKFWDKQAKKFDSNQDQFEPANLVIVSKTREYLNKNDTVLDFGCATGIKTPALADKTIQRINGLLKPGGLFISETACFKDKMDFKTRVTFAPIFLMKRLGAFPLHLNMYTFSYTEQQITDHGFKIVRSEKLFFNGMTISFIVAEKL